MSPIFFASTSAARHAKAPMCCISPGSGEEALQLPAHGIEPQLIVILSDINVPGMDGLTLLREIKRRRPDLPVMMVTAYGDDERRRHAAEAGALQFLTKPVNFDLLKEELSRLPGASTYEANQDSRGG
jgi:CheY-like chemotaxis protein